MQVAALLAVLAGQMVFVTTDRPGHANVIETMPERIADGEAVWIWSAECAPERVTAPAGARCRPGKRVSVRVATKDRRLLEGVEIRWGTDAMLRELPDAMLPAARTDAAGTATIVAPEGERILARAAGPAVASLWQDASSPIAALEGVPLEWRIVDADRSPATGVRIEIRSTGTAVVRGSGDGKVTIPSVPADSFLRVLAWSDSGAPVTLIGRARDLVRSLTLERGVTLRGAVVDENDKPVPDAVVSALFLAGSEAARVRKVVRTDGDGRFVMSGLPAGSVEWTVAKTPFARSRNLDQLLVDHDAGIVRLRASRELIVDVRDPRGEPIPDATLSGAEVTQGRTDAQGRATLAAVPASAFTIEARAHGFRRREMRIAQDAKQPVVVELRDAARIRARVVRGDGTAAGPGDVAVQVSGRTFHSELNGDGFVDIDAGEGGKVSLEIRAQGMAPFRVGEREVGDGEQVDLGTIELGSGFAIAGRAVDADALTPLPNAAVHVLRPNDFGPLLSYARRDWVTAHTGADGMFRIDGLAPGVYSLWTEAVGHAAAVRVGLTVAADLPNGELALGDLAIPPGKALAISCTPAARCGEQAIVTIPEADWLSVAAPVTGGAATIAPVPAGSVLLRLSDRSGTVHERTVTISSERPVTEVELRLSAVTVQGRVTRGGRAVSGGVVMFDPSSGTGGRFVQVAHVRTGGGSLGSEMVGAPPRVITGDVSAEGTFVMRDLTPGDYRVTWATGSAPSVPQRVHIPDTREIQVRIDLPAGRVEGRVVAPDGGAIPRTLVTVEAAGAPTQVLASADGSFLFDSLPAGTALVRARATDRREAEVRVEVRDGATEQIELTLRGGNADEALRVTVRGAGMPVANAYVFARQSGGIRSTMTAFDGTVRISGLRLSEPVHLAVFAPAFGWAFVPPRAAPEVTIDLQPAGAALTLQAKSGAGPAMLVAPTGFPIHEALAVLGYRVAVPLRVDRLPAGAYTATFAGQQRQIVLAAEPRIVDF